MHETVSQKGYHQISWGPVGSCVELSADELVLFLFSYIYDDENKRVYYFWRVFNVLFIEL